MVVEYGINLGEPDERLHVDRTGQDRHCKTDIDGEFGRGERGRLSVVELESLEDRSYGISSSVPSATR